MFFLICLFFWYFSNVLAFPIPSLDVENDHHHDPHNRHNISWDYSQLVSHVLHVNDVTNYRGTNDNKNLRK